MRALITGGAGFIGSHLADELIKGGGILNKEFFIKKFKEIFRAEMNKVKNV